MLNQEVRAISQAMSKKAMTTVEFLRLDRQAKMENQARQKYLLDQASRIAGARAEGIAEGRAKAITKGIAEGKKEMARKLLALGMDIALIAQASGLSEEEIKN
ncbi:Rpn family recombination-promoting nuclease/putative transposase [Paenibacillus thiaminolyticus]|uniref:Rpn family recombination-promoting nuclease/putative transposase n=1 Tax=Paenibacillus thiaminolyticus TaxID=49283 RepID=UPI003D2E3C0C